MTSFRKNTLFAAILLVTAMPVMASAAAPGSDVSEVTVSTADLDLASASGIATLRHRIRAASKTVCMAAHPQADVSSEVVRDCRIEAVHEASAAVQSAVRLAQANEATSLEASAVPR